MKLDADEEDVKTTPNVDQQDVKFCKAEVLLQLKITGQHRRYLMSQQSMYRKSPLQPLVAETRERTEYFKKLLNLMDPQSLADGRECCCANKQPFCDPGEGKIAVLSCECEVLAHIKEANHVMREDLYDGKFSIPFKFAHKEDSAEEKKKKSKKKESKKKKSKKNKKNKRSKKLKRPRSPA